MNLPIPRRIRFVPPSYILSYRAKSAYGSTPHKLSKYNDISIGLEPCILYDIKYFIILSALILSLVICIYLSKLKKIICILQRVYQ